MKTRFLPVAALALATGSLTTAILFAQPKPAKPSYSDEAIRNAVLEVNAKMTQAANRLDVDTFFSYILDGGQGTIIQNGTVFKTRQDAVNAVKQASLGVAKVDRQFINPQVTVISPDAALLASEGTVTATLEDGRKVENRFAVSLVFVRRGTEWKLLHGHYSMPG